MDTCTRHLAVIAFLVVTAGAAAPSGVTLPALRATLRAATQLIVADPAAPPARAPGSTIGTRG